MTWSPAGQIGWRQAHETGVSSVQALQTIAAAGDQIAIASNAPIVIAQLTQAGAVTLTSTPSIAPGRFDGQILICRVDPGAAAAVTIQDAGTLANSGVRLAAANMPLNARDLAMFIWVAAVSEWYNLSARVNNL